MEITNEVKQRIVAAIAADRENYPSDNRHATAPVSYTHLDVYKRQSLHRFKRKALLKKKFWRGGRVVDCGGLENRCAATVSYTHLLLEHLILREKINLSIKTMHSLRKLHLTWREKE